MPTRGHARDGEPSQNNASSATESSPEIPLAFGYAKAKRIPYALYDIIFLSLEILFFCTRELKNNCFFSQRRES